MEPLQDLWGGSDDVWPYREAAAVLVCFDFTKLNPLGGTESNATRAELLADCDLVSTEDRSTLWSLRTPIRREALSRLIQRGQLFAALGANPNRIQSVGQLIFEKCLSIPDRVGLSDSTSTLSSSVGGEFAHLNPEELAALFEVSSWLENFPEIYAYLPSRDILQQLLAREQLLHPFRALVGDHFAGRRNELDQMADYVGVFGSSSLGETVQRAIEFTLKISERPPLFVLGPGGSGKSTLIAKFILEHAEAAETSQFPFAYLDFDRPGLFAEEPITLLFEVLHQLVVQYPSSSKPYNDIIRRWASIATTESPLGRSGKLERQDKVQPIRLKGRTDLIDDFARFVSELESFDLNEQPFLLVLDTFEEVQFRNVAAEEEVLSFIADLQRRVPRLRTVICGRTEITLSNFSVKTMRLGNFDNEAALAFLKQRGVADEVKAQALIKQVGTSPLVLRLAAEIASVEGDADDGIKGLSPRWIILLRRQRIEVVLYRRILAHVHDERIKRLAFPGLVLRYITPEILLEVLAPVLNVPIRDLNEARQIVSDMQRQLTTILISSDIPDRLMHRPDMRMILVEELTARASQDDSFADLLAKIHRRAVEYYRRFDDAEHRAEEIFHLLALHADRRTIEQRWHEGLSPFLGSAILELPPKAQAFLAGRLEYEVPENIWRLADVEDWRLLAARRAREFLKLGNIKEALSLLKQRKEGWPNPASEPKTRALMDDFFSALAQAYERIRSEEDPGPTRTGHMTQVINDARTLTSVFDVSMAAVRRLFDSGSDGNRIVALGLSQSQDRLVDIDIAIEAIGNARSPFEQYQGCRLATGFSDLPAGKQVALREALTNPKGVPIDESDSSRADLRARLLARWPNPYLSK